MSARTGRAHGRPPAGRRRTRREGRRPRCPHEVGPGALGPLPELLGCGGPERVAGGHEPPTGPWTAAGGRPCRWSWSCPRRSRRRTARRWAPSSKRSSRSPSASTDFNRSLSRSSRASGSLIDSAAATSAGRRARVSGRHPTSARIRPPPAPPGLGVDLAGPDGAQVAAERAAGLRQPVAEAGPGGRRRASGGGPRPCPPPLARGPLLDGDAPLPRRAGFEAGPRGTGRPTTARPAATTTASTTSTITISMAHRSYRSPMSGPAGGRPRSERRRAGVASRPCPPHPSTTARRSSSTPCSRSAGSSSARTGWSSA